MGYNRKNEFSGGLLVTINEEEAMGPLTGN